MKKKLDINYLVERFKAHPSYLWCGAGSTLNKLHRNQDWRHFTLDDVKLARMIVKGDINVETATAPMQLPSTTQAKVLLLDIETAPLMTAVWRLWKQSVNSKQIVSDWFMLSWAAKWLYEEEVFSDVVTSEEATKQDDYRIVKSLHKLMEQADIIITYNGIKFDIPKINTRFLVWSLNPPGLYKQIDLYKTVSSQFAFSSNSMNFINQALEITTKEDTDMNLWINCYLGDKTALQKLVHYNRNDVIMTEEQYLILRPWIKSHPNLTLYGELDKEACGVCGNTDLGHYGYTTTIVGKYEVKKCSTCNSLLRSRVNVFNKQQRTNIIKTS